MKKIKRKIQSLVCILLCLVLCLVMFPITASAADTAEEKVVRAGWYEGTYNTTGENGEYKGYSYEYQQAVAARTGWTYEYVKESWSELLEMLENGEIDLLSGVSYTDERAGSMLFSELPMGEEKYNLYVDTSNMDISISDPKTLNGKRIGILSNALSAVKFSEWEEKYGVKTQHIEISGASDVQQKLEDCEIDGFVLNESPLWEKENLSAILVVGSSPIYFVVSKQRPDLKEELDIAMQKIERETPFYKDDLYKKYFSANSVEFLTTEEKDWLEQHGAIRVGYVKDDIGISLTDEGTDRPVGILNDYIEEASDCLGEPDIEFELTGFDSQEEQLQALKDNKIDMIFHISQNPYEAEQNGIIYSNTVFEANTAVITSADKFNENDENTVAINKSNLVSKWYVSCNYPQWKIKEYDSDAKAKSAVQKGEADCLVVKAGSSSGKLEDGKFHSVFLTKTSDSSFAVNKSDTVLLSILNKTLQTIPVSKLSGAFSVYENMSGKITLADYVKDNLIGVSIAFVSVILFILLLSYHLLMKAKKAQLQAEKANVAKSNFLFNMSHDIRTPMNAILGYSELMKKELTDPKLLDYQEKIEQSGNLLLSIINNVLDMARIENGKVELDENYVKIDCIYRGIFNSFEAEAAKKDVRLSMDYDVRHEHVICDETKNKEIFLNLISNAVKYTPSGGQITVKTEELPCDRDGYVRIKNEVIDTGIGMSKEFLPSLFTAFARERNTTTGKVAGTGLGMPIIKKYVDMMGGTITVESELGKGSKFTVILDYRIADKIYYDEKKQRAGHEDLQIQGKHILLAEDNDLNAEIAIAILEDMGLLIDRVEDGIKCVAEIERQPAGTYDLILMDIQMPNMDGYKATLAIRRLGNKKKAEIPIIAMTANAFEEDKKTALAKGMDGHIPKPIDVKKLKEVLQDVLK